MFASAIPLCLWLCCLHAEGDEMTSGIRSPVGRHQLESWEHYNLMVAHNIGAWCSLVFFAVLWRISKTNPLHRYLGRLLAVPLVLAIVTGFMLIYFRKSEELIHIHGQQIGRMTIVTQGFTVIGICLNAAVLQRWVRGPAASPGLLALHAFNLLLGLRSLHFLVSTYMQQGGYQTTEVNREVCFELLWSLTLPQLAIDSFYLALHFLQTTQPSQFVSKEVDWRAFHELGVSFLVYITSIGVFFNIAHDAYYIFPTPGITDLWKRMVIILCPTIYLAYKRVPMAMAFLATQYDRWQVAAAVSEKM
ncbi:hypothetical protein EON64_17330, partial [archaeon]